MPVIILAANNLAFRYGRHGDKEFDTDNVLKGEKPAEAKAEKQMPDKQAGAKSKDNIAVMVHCANTGDAKPERHSHRSYVTSYITSSG